MINELIRHMTSQIELYNKVIKELDLLEKDMTSNFDKKIVRDRRVQIEKLIYQYDEDIIALSKGE